MVGPANGRSYQRCPDVKEPQAINGMVYCRNQAGKIVLNPEVLLRWSISMAPRANWKGFLRLSLVTCPVALYPATSESEKISFNQINRNTGHRIKYLKVDADTGEEVSNEDITKGTKLTPTRR
jgi:hypothetical protein